MKEIILNELTRAAALVDGRTRVSDARTAISLLARYDVQAVGLSKEESSQHIRKLVRKLFPVTHPGFYDKTIAYCVEHAEDIPLRQLGKVPITKAELDRIDSLKSIRTRCLAFSLLAISKFDTMRYEAVRYWVKGDRWSESGFRANLHLTELELGRLIHEMYKNEMIGLADQFENCSLHILFADESENPEVVLWLDDSDYLDLGYTYRAYAGEPYIRCEECRRWIKKGKNGRTRFCKNCAADNQKALNRAYMRRNRAKNAQGGVL